MGVYASLKNTDLYGKMFMIDVNSDIAAGYDQYEALQLGTCTPRTGFLNGKWQNGYNAIQRANLAIRSIGEAPIDEVPKNQMLGEARFLRALIYFHLLDYFGGLPIYDETTDLEKEFNNLLKPRSSAEETRAFILADLEKALGAGLPDQWNDANYGRVTLSAAQALLGKVYLYDKQYDKAIENLEKSQAGHALHDDFAELFTPTGHTSSEMIFSIINLGGTGNSYGMPFYASTPEPVTPTAVAGTIRYLPPTWSTCMNTRTDARSTGTKYSPASTPTTRLRNVYSDARSTATVRKYWISRLNRKK